MTHSVFPAFCGTRKFGTMHTRVRHLTRVLSQIQCSHLRLGLATRCLFILSYVTEIMEDWKNDVM
jgi:hypothetical protein